MLKKLSMLPAFVLAVVVCVGSANANLLLRVTPDSSVQNMTPGQEVRLVISLNWVSGFQSYNGGDFMINSGSDSTFQATEFLIPPGPGTVGGWTAVPPAGGTQRFFTGGPTAPFTFSQTVIPGLTNGPTLTLGSIVLRAGNTAGSFSTFFTQVLQQDAGNVDIPNLQTANLSYSVVPEPSSAMLLGLAASGLAFFRRRS